ncbi:MAG: DNA-directed RNA polymerase subunit beta', partial [Actinomycetota bacterium]|nr:DNA-directed RNA polymerase subunit beta' [Actinomycetota bacterium]
MSISIDVNNFDALRIGLASAEKIRSWSNGEVKKPETINYRTLKPEKDGLFCERIFGPTKDWECYCGKYKRVRFKGIICERCGVEVTRSSVRRERMGHIELASPVSHIWFFKGVPSRLGYILGLTPKDLEKVLYFDSYIIISIDKERINAEKDKIKSLYEDYLYEMQQLHEERIKGIKENNEDFLRRYREGELLTELEAFDDSELESEKDVEAKIAKIIKENEKLLEEEEEIYQEHIEIVKKAQALFHNLEEKMLISDESLFKKLKEIYGAYFKGGMGAEAVKELLKNIDCEKEVEELKLVIETSKGQKRSKAIKTLKILSSFVNTNNKPEYMILDVLPVIPPDLRPMVQLDGGRFATSDLNDLYRRVINRNNRLKKLLELDAPEIIINNEKRMLQEAVDALFDNGRRGRAVLGAGNRPLKSLSDMLKGKQGRFRQNLLGKRVDYSGRSVIVVNPNLRLDQCGLPKQIALELFKPFVMKKLVDEGHATNIKSAKIMVERGDDKVWDILEAVIKNHPVLLNRAPTLHRLGIQAFMPILVEGKAIQIHPLVCPPFNADFDGDQMAVHVPLSNEAKAEAIILMLASNNILSPASGEPVSTPSQDMVLGIYYMTSERIKSDGKEKYYPDSEDALKDYDYGFIKLHTPIRVKIKDKVLKTTVGRIIFNEALPKDFEFINKEIAKKELISIMNRCIRKYPNYFVVDVLDNIKKLGFKYSTKSGLTIGIDDIIVPPKKEEILRHAEDNIAKIESYYQQGMITDDERHERVIQSWSEANEAVAEAMERNFDRFNPIYMMATSGARGNIKQLRQLAGMRGLVANARGDILDRPIKSNFREGLTVLEYFLSTHGARQGLADTALRTADSGYLTRRLVDVAHDTMIRINDCKTDEGINLYVLNLEGEPNHHLIGRSSQQEIKDPRTGHTILNKGTEIDEEILQKLVQANVPEINVRSVLTCEAEMGVCQKCYGRNLSSGKEVDIGEAVGIIAAQSIGEPGTQLTMRTFHTGGVASTVIQRSIKSPVKGRLIFNKDLLSKLGLKITENVIDYVNPPSEHELYGISSNMLKIRIEHIPHKLTFKVKMEEAEKEDAEAGQFIDIIIPRGEELLLTNSINVERNQVFAILISTAKKKRYVHKHEKTFEGIDITSGLPRVVELFEARKPKEHAIIAEASGIIKIEDLDSKLISLTIVNPDGSEEKTYEIPSRSKIRFNEGEMVHVGDQLTEGQRNPHDILRLNGIKVCEQYLVREIRDVYKAQGVEINDKHIEIIVRQ